MMYRCLATTENKYRVRKGYVINFMLIAQEGEVLINPPEKLIRENLHKLEPVNGHRAPSATENGSWEHFMKEGAWEGRRCFIIGGGPSLKGFDFSRLKGELAIGVNRAFEQIDPAVIFSIDSRLHMWIRSGNFGPGVYEKFLACQSHRVWLDTHGYQFGPGVTSIPAIRGTSPGTNQALGENLTIGLPHFGNSGLAALNLAIILGADPIYLLGFDMNTNGKFQQWWHDGYPMSQRDDVYENFRHEFELVAPEIHRRGVKVINLNPDSGVKCFEFGEFPGPLPQPPLFVSCYTPGLYADKAARLRRSLHFMGLEYQIEEVGDRGSWDANTKIKAEFILRMLETHPRQNVVWLDADAVIREYPAGFWKIEKDFAVNYFRDIQLASGTLFFQNNKRALALVKAWIKENQEHPEQTDQHNLQAVVESNVVRRLSAHRLPAEYCYFDKVEGIDKPVVEHFQASREAKHIGGIVWECKKQEEFEKYAKTWAIDQYRKISPGLNVAPEAFKVLSDLGLKRRDTLTDYGCGTGRAGKFFVKEGLWVCGVDICPEALEEQLDKFVSATLWDLPPETPTTDWAFCVDVLEHLPEDSLSATIKGIVRRTRKGGFFQIAHFSSEFHGEQLHLTIKSNAWWVEFLKDRLPGFQNYRTDERRSIYIFKTVGNL